MYRFSNENGRVVLYVGENSEENNTVALVSCAIKALGTSCKSVEAQQLEKEACTCMLQNGDCESMEGIIKKYVKLYIVKETSPLYKTLFNQGDM